MISKMEYLILKSPNGFKDVVTAQEKFCHNKLLDNFNSSVQNDDGLCKLDLPDPCDRLRLLISNNHAIGFYTIKPEGTYIVETRESYCFPTLDTAFVLSGFRRRGHGLSIIEDLVSLYPDKDIGVSHPVSDAMLKVFKKYLLFNLSMKTKFWIIEGGGEEGRRKLLYLEIARRNKVTK